MKNPIFLLLFAATQLFGYPSGSRIPAGNAGETGTGTPCASCHTVTLNPSGGSVNLSLPSGAVYRAGETQRWTLTVTDPNTSWRNAFQLTASAGTFKAVSSTVVTSAANGRQYVAQSAPAATFSFDWTGPSGSGPVTVWVAGAAVNTTRQTRVYTTSISLTASGARPAIRSADGVVNGASMAAGFSAGSWVTIFGTNLAPAGVARTWKTEEIVDGKLPLQLEGTSVRINGKPAAVSYVSETQLNVQAPDDTALGSVSVDVTTANGTSAVAAATLSAAAPGLFRFSPVNNRYAAAVHGDSVGTLAGPAGLFGDGATLLPVKPGETILLFGTGFGPTNPVAPAGQTFSGAASLIALDSLQIRIGGLPATVQFAGIAGAGLFQFNVLVPEVPDGDQTVEASVSGQSTPTVQYVSVQR